MELKDLAANTLKTAETLLKKRAEGVIGMRVENKNWKVLVEMLERKAIPDTQDLLGRYEFEVNPKGEVLEYKQKLLRRRGDSLKEGE